MYRTELAIIEANEGEDQMTNLGSAPRSDLFKQALDTCVLRDYVEEIPVEHSLHLRYMITQKGYLEYQEHGTWLLKLSAGINKAKQGMV